MEEVSASRCFTAKRGFRDQREPGPLPDVVVVPSGRLNLTAAKVVGRGRGLELFQKISFWT